MSTERMDVIIRDLAAGGEGVADLPDGSGVVFVPSTVPGDSVRVRVTRTSSRRRWHRGWVEELLASGPDRVTPACSLADRCGGCAWQHVAYPAQLQAKGRLLARALRISGLKAEIEPPVEAPAELGYRCRARLVWRAGREPALGFRSARSHDVVGVAACPVLLPHLGHRLAPLRRALALLPSATVHLLGSPSGEVAVGLGPADAPHGRRRSGPRSRARAQGAQQVSAASLEVLFSDPLLELTGLTVIGRDGGEHAVHGLPLLDTAPHGARPVLATPAGFAQANPFANELLRAMVDRWSREGELGSVLELYALDSDPRGRWRQGRHRGGVEPRGRGSWQT